LSARAVTLYARSFANLSTLMVREPFFNALQDRPPLIEY
jgi:hypothetical protein